MWQIISTCIATKIHPITIIYAITFDMLWLTGYHNHKRITHSSLKAIYLIVLEHSLSVFFLFFLMTAFQIVTLFIFKSRCTRCALQTLNCIYKAEPTAPLSFDTNHIATIAKCSRIFPAKWWALEEFELGRNWNYFSCTTPQFIFQLNWKKYLDWREGESGLGPGLANKANLASLQRESWSYGVFHLYSNYQSH